MMRNHNPFTKSARLKICCFFYHYADKNYSSENLFCHLPGFQERSKRTHLANFRNLFWIHCTWWLVIFLRGIVATPNILAGRTSVQKRINNGILMLFHLRNALRYAVYLQYASTPHPKNDHVCWNQHCWWMTLAYPNCWYIPPFMLVISSPVNYQLITRIPTHYSRQTVSLYQTQSAQNPKNAWSLTIVFLGCPLSQSRCRFSLRWSINPCWRIWIILLKTFPNNR